MREFLGSLIRKCRAEAGISLRELASQVGCVPSFLSELENGLRGAPKDKNVLTKIANALNIDQERLYTSAKNDLARRDMKELKDLFARDDELAACYCRAKEQCGQDDLKKILMKAFQQASAKGRGGE